MPRWTEEQRKAQGRRMQELKPWLKSSGPNTEDGKQKSSLNALKHGLRSETAKEIRQVLRKQAGILKGLP